MKKTVRFFALILSVSFFSILCWHYFTSTDLSDSQKQTEFIAGQDHVKNISIKESKSYAQYLAVSYTEGQNERLLVCRRDCFFQNRYHYFGGGCSRERMNFYNVHEGTSQALIVLYGDNTNPHADSYRFCNNNKVYSKQDLGKYILELYLIHDTPDAGFQGHFYDRAGNVVHESNGA